MNGRARWAAERADRAAERRAERRAALAVVDADDLTDARDDLGPAATAEEVREVAERRAAVRVTEHDRDPGA